MDFEDIQAPIKSDSSWLGLGVGIGILIFTQKSPRFPVGFSNDRATLLAAVGTTLEGHVTDTGLLEAANSTSIAIFNEDR